MLKYRDLLSWRSSSKYISRIRIPRASQFAWPPASVRATSRERNRMKKLHSASVGAVLLAAIGATTFLILPAHAQAPANANANSNGNGSVANQTGAIGSQTAAPSVDVSVTSQAAHK